MSILTTLLLAQAVPSTIVERSINNEMERTWKKWSWPAWQDLGRTSIKLAASWIEV